MAAVLPVVARRLGAMLSAQLGDLPFLVRVGPSSTGPVPEPNVMVLAAEEQHDEPHHLPALDPAGGPPSPLVVEVWSPEPGACTLRAGLRFYRQRGDAEIWFIHTGRRRVTIWRRQPDGSYTRSSRSSGVIEPAALPGVHVDIDRLFAEQPVAR